MKYEFRIKEARDPDGAPTFTVQERPHVPNFNWLFDPIYEWQDIGFSPTFNTIEKAKAYAKDRKEYLDAYGPYYHYL